MTVMERTVCSGPTDVQGHKNAGVTNALSQVTILVPCERDVTGKDSSGLLLGKEVFPLLLSVKYLSREGDTP